MKSELGDPRIVTAGPSNAKSYLASRMFTDAVFNQDIRVIATIIGRVDGGLPKDTDLGSYQTLFGDCMNEVLEMTSGDQLKVLPDDTVMMALCKSLYDIATTDIYHQMKVDKDGTQRWRKVTPSTEKKQARDQALRLVLERAGGRKTPEAATHSAPGRITVADWIAGALPQEGEASGDRPDVQEAGVRGAGVAL